MNPYTSLAAFSKYKSDKTVYLQLPQVKIGLLII